MGRILLVIYVLLLAACLFLAIRWGAGKVIGMVRTSEETNIVASNVIATVAMVLAVAILIAMF